MKKAVKRIHKAIIDQERVMVYGDYDVDGTYLRCHGCLFRSSDVQIVPLHPMRYQEGYGVSKDGDR